MQKAVSLWFSRSTCTLEPPVFFSLTAVVNSGLKLKISSCQRAMRVIQFIIE